MKNQILNFKTKHYFQGVFMFVGVTLGMAALILTIFEPLAAFLFAIITFLAFTTVYKVKIDVKNKTCREYLWFLGFTKGETLTFQKVSQLKMHEQRMSQKLHSRGSSTTIRYTLYTGYIIFDDDKKVYVGESKDRDRMLEKLQCIGEKLRAEVVEE
jgi:hypothetical protein